MKNLIPYLTDAIIVRSNWRSKFVAFFLILYSLFEIRALYQYKMIYPVRLDHQTPHPNWRLQYYKRHTFLHCLYTLCYTKGFQIMEKKVMWPLKRFVQWHRLILCSCYDKMILLFMYSLQWRAYMLPTYYPCFTWKNCCWLKASKCWRRLLTVDTLTSLTLSA